MFVDADCHLCHAVPDVPAPPRQDSCDGCHAWVRAVAANPEKRERAKAIFPKWERYENNVATYLAVPSLSAAMARLEPEWVGEYLSDPHDLRPTMPETMPRFDLDAHQLSVLVTAFDDAQFNAPTTALPSRDRVVLGAEVFERQGCPSCHTFGSLHQGPGIPAAPDLAHTRRRMTPDMTAAWISEPWPQTPRWCPLDSPRRRSWRCGTTC